MKVVPRTLPNRAYTRATDQFVMPKTVASPNAGNIGVFLSVKLPENSNFLIG